ncbi:MAG: methyltransferase domain-containing protein [Deltaproteobacteria bacterium]|nr:methyltransferase domain-containing protein [Deltaproteobacteria bacterium]
MHTHSAIPPEFLVENICLLPKGKALDIAMGEGRNSVYLAQNGFHVEGVDSSQDAISTANALAKEKGVKITTSLIDLEKDPFIKASTYDVIICFNYLQRSLFPGIINGLCANGVIVYETYIVDQARFGRPKSPDHLLQHNELLELFRGFRVLRYHEGIMAEERAVAGIIAEKSAL